MRSRIETTRVAVSPGFVRCATSLTRLGSHLRVQTVEICAQRSAASRCGPGAVAVGQHLRLEEDLNRKAEQLLQRDNLVRAGVRTASAEVLDAGRICSQRLSNEGGSEIVKRNELGELLSPVWESHENRPGIVTYPRCFGPRVFLPSGQLNLALL